MATVVLRNLGGSVILAVPKKILDLVQLDAGSAVDLRVERGRLVVAPQQKPRYTLNELLSRCRRSDLAPRPKDRSWQRSLPVGREVL